MISPRQTGCKAPSLKSVVSVVTIVCATGGYPASPSRYLHVSDTPMTHPRGADEAPGALKFGADRRAAGRVRVRAQRALRAGALRHRPALQSLSSSSTDPESRTRPARGVATRRIRHPV